MAVFTAPRLFAAFALAAIALPVAASAAESAPNPTVVSLSTSGMDLANPAAQAMLTHRIVLAARKVCGQAFTDDVLFSDAYDTCVRSAEADAHSQMESRLATASTRAMVATIASK